MVCSITRGPAKPISAFGSARITSPNMATLAVTPPNVGSANRQINGSLASPSLATAAEVLAICIRERIPSCIRAPPEVVTKMTGNLASSARSIPADLFSDDRPHAAAHKTEVEHAEHHTASVHHPFADHHGIFASGLPLVRLHTILVRFRVLKVQRVLGAELRIPLFERPEVDQERNALHNRNREMVVALWADLIITLDFFAIDDFSAMVTLEPHPFRNLGSLWRFRLGRFLFFKPGHNALLLVASGNRETCAKSATGETV